MTTPAAQDLTIIGTVAFDQSGERHAFYFFIDGRECYCYGPALHPGEPPHHQGSKLRMTGRWLPGSDSVFLAGSIGPVAGAG